MDYDTTLKIKHIVFRLQVRHGIEVIVGGKLLLSLETVEMVTDLIFQGSSHVSVIITKKATRSQVAQAPAVVPCNVFAFVQGDFWQ